LLVVLPASAQTVRVGELNSYKAFASFLEPYRKGWVLAVEEVNAAGGVLGIDNFHDLDALNALD
jgi:branched-chain amino acid transport system substrate-binding protein